MTTVDLEQQRLLIGGEWTEASGGGTFERVDPFTGDAVTLAAAAGREDAKRAVDAAAAAFPAWSATPAGERRALLNAAADKLMEAAPDVAAIMTEEVGGTFGWGMFNCDLASRMLREAAAQAYSVLPDADLEAAADAASFGAFMNSGQICMSTERIVADRSVADDLGAKLADRAGKLTTGDPRDQGTMIGPVINDASRERVLELIEDAKAKGAQVLAGGDADGNAITPTVLSGVTPEMRIYGEESFGPVVTIVPVEGTDEAVRVANDTEYGLAAAVFGEDVDAAMAVARRIESGICHVNSSTVHDEPQMPFGGVKASGWGRFGGRAALEEFTELRWMTVQQGARHYPI